MFPNRVLPSCTSLARGEKSVHHCATEVFPIAYSFIVSDPLISAIDFLTSNRLILVLKLIEYNIVGGIKFACMGGRV